MVAIPSFTILRIGTIKEPHCRALHDLYLKRLMHEARITVKEIGDSTSARESAQLMDAIDKINGYTIALSEEGTLFTSRQFAAKIGSITKNILFVIGGHDGLADPVRKRADCTMSLSPLTFTHEIAAVLLAEQLYRACSILHNKKYHRD